MNPIFLPVPAETNPALREDIFTAQVTGLIQPPQMPPSLREETLTVCEAFSVMEVVQRLKVIHLLGDWPVPETPSGQAACVFFPLPKRCSGRTQGHRPNKSIFQLPIGGAVP